MVHGAPGISSSLLFAVLAAPLALGGCAMTSTYGTGEAPEVALLHEMTGGLVTKPKKKQIDYEPRAPLVMPPSDAASAAGRDRGCRRPGLAGRSRSAEVARVRPLRTTSPDDGARATYKQTRPLAGLPAERRHDARARRSDNDVDRQDDLSTASVSARQQRDAFAKAVADAKGYNPQRSAIPDRSAAAPIEQPTDTAPTGECDRASGRSGASGGASSLAHSARSRLLRLSRASSLRESPTGFASSRGRARADPPPP